MTLPKLAVIAERRYLRQRMPEALLRVFGRRGVHVELFCPHACLFNASTGLLHTVDGRGADLNHYDVIVSRNRNALGLAMLAYADTAGILAINSHAATQRVRNKAKLAIALGQAGIPCAPTFLASDALALVDLPDSWFPLLLKATYGDNSQGLRLIRSREELSDVHWNEELVLAQAYLPNDGFDLKLYVCGEQVFAVRKPSPFNGDPNAAAKLLQPDARMIDLALRCGQLFGLDIYGVDTIETVDGPCVIEVNDFPNFTGIPQAAEHLADFILARARGEHAHAYRVSVAAAKP